MNKLNELDPQVNKVSMTYISILLKRSKTYFVHRMSIILLETTIIDLHYKTRIILK